MWRTILGQMEEDDSDASKPDEKYKEAYYQGVIQAVKMNEEMGRSFWGPRQQGGYVNEGR